MFNPQFQAAYKNSLTRKELQKAGYFEKVSGEIDSVEVERPKQHQTHNRHNVPNKRRNAAKARKYAKKPVSGYATKHAAVVAGKHYFTPKMEQQAARSFRLYNHLTREERREALEKREETTRILEAIEEMNLFARNSQVSESFPVMKEWERYKEYLHDVEESAYWAGYTAGYKSSSPDYRIKGNDPFAKGYWDGINDT